MSDGPGSDDPGLRRAGAGWMAVTVLAIVVAGSVGCRSTGQGARPMITAAEADRAREVLQRPLPGPLVALYRLRVPSTGGLRLSVLADGDTIRLTVSENFGSAVMTAGTDAGGTTEVFDLREGCRLEGVSAGRALGLGAFGLQRIIAMLGGRLPAVDGDRIRTIGDGPLVEISGDQWASVAELATDPPRIRSMRGMDWAVELSDHTASVPGTIRVDRTDGEWAEIELVRLKWEFSGAFPDLPDLPLCRR